MTTISPLRRKSVDTVLHQDDEGHRGALLKKTLGARDLIAFGIGMIIGTGIFTLTGIQA